MKVRCDRNALFDACQLAAGVVAGRTPKPALQCIRLQAQDKSLTLSATDLEIALRYRVDSVEILSPGDVVVPADRFNAILRESHDQTIDIESDGDACRIVCADSKFKVFGYDAREFPTIPDFPEKAGFTVKAGILKQLIERTVFAAAKEITRYAINGVLWEPRGKRMKMVGTDGKRLAQSFGPLQADAADDRAGVCPLKTMNLLKSLLVDPESDVEVKITENELKVRCGAAMVSSRLVEGDYPKYDEVIPKENDKSAEFESDALASAIKRAALLVSVDSRRVVFNFTAGNLELRSSAPEYGEAEVNTPADYKGDPLQIAFNPDYMVDGLKALGQKRAKFEFRSNDRPGVLRSENEFIYVVMPLTMRSPNE